jgi:hypothetical protein
MLARDAYKRAEIANTPPPSIAQVRA